MYRSFSIENFRCFEQLTLSSLGQVNLIAGGNNVGKTAVLEALFVYSGAYNPALVLTLSSLRGIGSLKLERGRWTETPWAAIFRQFDTNNTITLRSRDDDGSEREVELRSVQTTDELVPSGLIIDQRDGHPVELPLSAQSGQILELRYRQGKSEGKHSLLFEAGGIRITPRPPAPPFPVVFLGAGGSVPLSEDAERLGRLDVDGRQDIVLTALQAIEPRLTRLAVVVTAETPIIHGDIGLGRLIPLPLMGGGMTRLASLVLAIGNAPGGVVLIDEIEIGLHYSVLSNMWRTVSQAASLFNTQIFATTHSRECIDAAHAVFTQRPDEYFRLHRLDRSGNVVRAVTYDQETLEAATNMGLEVR